MDCSLLARTDIQRSLIDDVVPISIRKYHEIPATF